MNNNTAELEVFVVAKNIKPPQPTHCEYTLLENGIHYFKYLDATPASLEDWINYVNTIYENVTESSRLMFIIDSRTAGFHPIGYTFRRGREWVNTLNVHPQVRMAMLYSDNMLTSMFETLLKSLKLGHLEIGMFTKPTALEDATAWALRDWYTKK